MGCGGRVVPAAVRMVMEDEDNCIISGEDLNSYRNPDLHFFCMSHNTLVP